MRRTGRLSAGCWTLIWTVGGCSVLTAPLPIGSIDGFWRGDCCGLRDGPGGTWYVDLTVNADGEINGSVGEWWDDGSGGGREHSQGDVDGRHSGLDVELRLYVARREWRFQGRLDQAAETIRGSIEGPYGEYDVLWRPHPRLLTAVVGRERGTHRLMNVNRSP